jgi:DNA (cytosine-5)-methyltransferase 1
MPPLRYISLFSGGFGLDLGMEAADFEVAACVEIASAMRETIRHNRPHVEIIGDGESDAGGDLYKLSTEFIMERAGVRQGEIDLVVGGPPCQSFSILGKRQGLDDPRGSLMLEFVRVVREAKPRGFILENVVGFTNLHKGEALKQVKALLEEEEYKVHVWVLNAVDFGVPQYRERVFLVGFHKSMPQVEDFPKPVPTYRPPSPLTLFDVSQTADSRPEYLMVRDVLFNMPQDLPNHELRVHGDTVRRRYEELAEGARDRIDHTDRLRWDTPSGTVLVGSSEGGGRPFIHPGEPRHITVREAARLQTFPDTWVFCGTQTDQYRQVGNAVPFRLSRAVALHVASYFRQYGTPSGENRYELHVV